MDGKPLKLSKGLFSIPQIPVETSVVGEQELHDWRLRVVDNAGGDTGYIDNFIIHVG